MTILAAALSQHIAVLGKTGSGKSYAVRGAVELLLDEHARVCVIDPTGAWHGLRSSATGKSAGYPVVIFGGNHADLPLGGAHGEAIAEVIGTSTTPSILDTSLMKVGERTRFFTDFADAIVRKNKGPLHLVIDEAHLFMPQSKVSDPQSGAMMHAGNNMVSLGRSRGLRIILITQRPAKLHKDALTQAETLIAMRLIAPQDRAAVEAWIEDNADEAKAREIIGSLATLKTGQGWIWAPELGVLERVTFPKIKTFDSGRAPDGSEAEAAKVLAPIDLPAISKRLETVSAAAVAHDPKRLLAKVEELERELARAKAPAPAVSNKTDVDAAYKSGYDTGYMHGSGAGEQSAYRQFAALREAAVMAFELLRSRILESAENAPPPDLPKWQESAEVPHAPGRLSQPIQRVKPETPDRFVPHTGNGADDALKAMPRAMLTALAQYPDGLTKGQVLVHTGYRSSGATSKSFAELVRNGWVQVMGDKLLITGVGSKTLGTWEPLPRGKAMREYLLNGLKCSSMEKAILRVLFETFPEPIAKGRILEHTGYQSSGATSKAFARLTALGYAKKSDRGTLRANEELF